VLLDARSDVPVAAFGAPRALGSVDDRFTAPDDAGVLQSQAGWTDRSADRTLSTRTRVKGRDPRSELEVESSALSHLGQMLFARTDRTVHASSGDQRARGADLGFESVLRHRGES